MNIDGVQGDSRGLYILAIAITIALAGILIVADGGPPSAFAHFMYAPIILASLRFGVVAGLLVGALAGVIAGPLTGWLALEGALLTTEHLIEWLIRGSWFAAIGAVLGVAFAHARHQSRSLDQHLHTDPTTALPNLRAARRYIRAILNAEGDEQDVLVTALRMLNYQDLANQLGHEQADKAMHALGRRLRGTLPRGTFISRTGPDSFAVIDRLKRDESIDRYVERTADIDHGTLRAGDLSVYVDTAMGVVRASATEADPPSCSPRRSWLRREPIPMRRSTAFTTPPKILGARTACGC